MAVSFNFRSIPFYVILRVFGRSTKGPMHDRPEELIKTDHRMHHNQANHKHSKHHEICCDFFMMCYPVRQRTGSFTTTDFTDWTDIF